MEGGIGDVHRLLVKVAGRCRRNFLSLFFGGRLTKDNISEAPHGKSGSPTQICSDLFRIRNDQAFTGGAAGAAAPVPSGVHVSETKTSSLQETRATMPKSARAISNAATMPTVIAT